MKNKKILFVVTGLARGGAERVLCNLTSHFSEIGYEVAIITVLYSEVGYKFDSNIKIIDISNAEKESRLKKIPIWVKEIRKNIKKVDPDVIISFSLRINILALLANSKQHKKIIISERNDPKRDGRGLILKLLSFCLYKYADAIVFQTSHAKSCFPDFIQKKGIIIQNPIDVACYAANSRRKKVVNVARLYKQKNHRLLIDAFLTFKRKFPEYSLHIYGEGPLETELKNYVKEQKNEASIIFHGNVENVHNHIADADFFVLSSDYEGMSNALIEALMMGIPCISTNVAGAADALNEKNGILIPTGNKDKLTEAMCVLASLDEDIKENMGEAAKEIAEKFKCVKVFQKWDLLLKKVI